MFDLSREPDATPVVKSITYLVFELTPDSVADQYCAGVVEGKIVELIAGLLDVYSTIERSSSTCGNRQSDCLAIEDFRIVA